MTRKLLLWGDHPFFWIGSGGSHGGPGTEAFVGGRSVFDGACELHISGNSRNAPLGLTGGSPVGKMGMRGDVIRVMEIAKGTGD